MSERPLCIDAEICDHGGGWCEKDCDQYNLDIDVDELLIIKKNGRTNRVSENPIKIFWENCAICTKKKPTILYQIENSELEICDHCISKTKQLLKEQADE